MGRRALGLLFCGALWPVFQLHSFIIYSSGQSGRVRVVVRGVGGLVGSACIQLAALGVNYKEEGDEK